MKLENSCIFKKNHPPDQKACQSTCPKVTEYLKKCLIIERQLTLEAIELYEMCGVYPCSVIEHLSSCNNISTKEDFVKNAIEHIPFYSIKNQTVLFNSQNNPIISGKKSY